MAKARAVRRQGFMAGRACARRALNLLGGPSVAIPVAADRRPLWPEGFVGSITHTDSVCAAVAGQSARYLGLGLDIETDVPLAEAMRSAICSAGELAEGRELMLAGGLRVDRAKLTFVAKETLFKAYYPAVRHFLDFPDARVAFEPKQCRFEAELLRADAPALGGRRRFEGRFGQADGMLFAVMAVRRG